jgi:hypothetical protein
LENRLHSPEEGRSFPKKFAHPGKPDILAQRKKSVMKKIMTVLVIAAAMTACNGTGETTTTMDSAISGAADTAKAGIDSAAAKVDSAIRAAADTTKTRIGNAVDSARKAIKK